MARTLPTLALMLHSIVVLCVPVLLVSDWNALSALCLSVCVVPMAADDACPATALDAASPTLLESSLASAASPTLLDSSSEASRSRSPRVRGDGDGSALPVAPHGGSAFVGQSGHFCDAAASGEQTSLWSRRSKAVVIFRGASTSSRPFRIPADMVSCPERGTGACERRAGAEPASVEVCFPGIGPGPAKFDPFSVLW